MAVESEEKRREERKRNKNAVKIRSLSLPDEDVVVSPPREIDPDSDKALFIPRSRICNSNLMGAFMTMDISGKECVLMSNLLLTTLGLSLV